MNKALRRPPQRSTGLVCGCLAAVAALVVVIGVVIVVLIFALLPGFALQSAGFSPKGSTSQVFVNVPPVPAPQVQNPIAPPQVVLNLGSLGSQELPQSPDFSVTVGHTTGSPLAEVMTTEAGLMNLCHQRVDVCGGSSLYRNPRVDLRPGGAVIYADVFIKDFAVWQPIGVVLRLDSTQRQFVAAGVDVNGTLYSLPASDLGDSIRQIASEGNRLLDQLSLEAGGGIYHLYQVVIDDTTLTLVLR